MNKRLEKLALECGAWHQIYDQKRFMVDSNFDIEKFAELIVRECADICYNRDYTNGSAYGEAIEEHFGVE